MSTTNMLGLISPNGRISLAHIHWHPEDGGYTLPLPAGFELTDLEFLRVVDRTLVIDISAKLAAAKAVRIARIKAEAAERISALDWRLARATEREDAGWATLAATDAVLAERESIRRSSNVAEAALAELDTVAAVLAFTWSTTVTVAPPTRVTHAQFLDALLAQGDEVITNILLAKESAPSLLTWWTYFDQAEWLSTSDPRLSVGLQGLEIAGLLPPGGAQDVLDQLATSPAPITT